MAIFFPPNPPADKASDPKYSGEMKHWRAFKSLDDSWRVFYSVYWQSIRGNRQGDGETDFILVHPSKGILVLEIKGGRVAVENGNWTSTDRNGGVHSIKNPFEQAMNAKYLLVDKLDEMGIPAARRPSVCHAVSFPDGMATGNIGLYGNEAIIWTGQDLQDVGKAIHRTLSHWDAKGSMKPSDLKSVINLLAPTRNITSGLRGSVAATELELIQLTDQQIDAMEMLRRVRRAHIVGGPGTGKTVLAVHRAKQLAEEGAAVLLTCFNAPLGNRLTREVAGFPNVRVGNFHSICLAEARKAGISVPSEIDDGWWENDAPEVLLQAAEINGLKFDAVIVDEVQDFAESWLSALVMLLGNPEDGFFIDFGDQNQALYRDTWGLPDDAEIFPLSINCRSTLEILDRVNRILDEEAAGRGVSGPKPTFTTARTADDGLAEAQEIVARLVGPEGLDPASVVVLCMDRRDVDKLQGRSVGPCSLVEMGKVGVQVGTIHRYKGLESEAVVVVLGDHDLADPKDLLLAYVGLSRARSVLAVIGSKSARQAIRWP